MAAQSYLVDVTRIASRLGRGAMTGIDRVELAYIRALSAMPIPAKGVLRTKAGVLLLAPPALGALLSWAEGRSSVPQRRDMLARLTRRNNPELGRVETALRQFALARAPLALAGSALCRHLPAGTVYFNVGHTNLSRRMMLALRKVLEVRIAVLVHDTIPLDHPEFTRPDQIAPFARKLAVVSDHADLVIHTANATRLTTEAHLAFLGRVPMGVVAPLGVEIAAPDPAALPFGLDLSRPYFIAVGTIEPRKNHAFLLDLWAAMAASGADLPQLYIVGNRGWAAPGLLERLDRGVKGVTVLSGLSDASMMALIDGARAMLFASHVEGFGLPPFEAAAMGTRVISAPLPVIREGLGDYPVYLATTDSYSWMETIRALSVGPIRDAMPEKVDLPNWHDHFKTVLSTL